MPWNLNSSRPIFLQLIEIIQMDIISGKYPPGGKLPSVRDWLRKRLSTRIQCKKRCQN